MTPEMKIATLGNSLPRVQMAGIRERLLGRLQDHLLTDISDSVPIACRLRPEEQADELQATWLLQAQKLIVYLENYDLMVRATATAALRFFSELEPWEDIDACLFDDSMDWCAAVTHNSQAKYRRL